MAQTAKARRTRVRRAAGPVLPDELVLWEILISLPTKMLLRCRAVCRSWRHLTSSDDFLHAHHQRQPLLPLVTFRGETSDSGRDFVDAAVDAFDLRGDPAAAKRHPVLRFEDYNHRRSFAVHSSCDGLLVLSLSNNRFYICNPATRQWAALPKQLICGHAATLYKHSSSGEYRILYWKGSYFGAEFYVLTVGSSTEPRHLGRFIAGSSPPVMLHNCIYWADLPSQANKLVLVFDTILESFRCMNSPTTNNCFCPNVLLETDGMLGISCIRKNQTTVDLWVLQDYEGEIWSLKYQIELPMAEFRSIAKSCIFNGLIVLEDGGMLVYCECKCHLFYCDNKGKLQRKFHWDRVLPFPTDNKGKLQRKFQWFKESLVRHAFFQRQGRARVKQPRFFRGL